MTNVKNIVSLLQVTKCFFLILLNYYLNYNFDQIYKTKTQKFVQNYTKSFYINIKNSYNNCYFDANKFYIKKYFLFQLIKFKKINVLNWKRENAKFVGFLFKTQ